MKNNKPKQDENTNKADFSPSISINIPVKANEAKIQEVLESLDIDAPLPPLGTINQINLQITVESGGKNND